MKDIGKTERGGRIVEMSETEHNAFIALKLALDGNSDVWKTLPCIFDPMNSLPHDCTFVLTAITQWVDLRMHTNAIRSQLDGIDMALGIKT